MGSVKTFFVLLLHGTCLFQSTKSQMYWKSEYFLPSVSWKVTSINQKEHNSIFNRGSSGNPIMCYEFANCFIFFYSSPHFIWNIYYESLLFHKEPFSAAAAVKHSLLKLRNPFFCQDHSDLLLIESGFIVSAIIPMDNNCKAPCPLVKKPLTHTNIWLLSPKGMDARRIHF